MKQLTVTIEIHLTDKGVRVNAIGPGSIVKDMVNSRTDDEATRHMIMSRTPMGRLGEPSKISSV